VYGDARPLGPHLGEAILGIPRVRPGPDLAGQAPGPAGRDAALPVVAVAEVPRAADRHTPNKDGAAGGTHYG
jgi:hypothetical protein